MLGRHWRQRVSFLIKFRGQGFCVFHAPQNKTCFVVVLLKHQKDLHRRGFKITQIPNTKRKTRVKPGTVAHKGHATNKKVAANKIKYKDGWNFVGSNYHVT